jgi:hypothetical protein
MAPYPKIKSQDLPTTQIQALVTEHQHRPNNDRFVLNEKPEENGQSTNLCKNNQSAIPAEGRRTQKTNK